MKINNFWFYSILVCLIYITTLCPHCESVQNETSTSKLPENKLSQQRPPPRHLLGDARRDRRERQRRRRLRVRNKRPDPSTYARLDELIVGARQQPRPSMESADFISFTSQDSPQLLMAAPPLARPPMINQHAGPTCVDIPHNLTLCRGIGYGKMRLPNLLEHDTLVEVVTQARSWVPLLSVGCHPDARLFLCSLYSPVCLDRPIYPCRSLCLAVRAGCEYRMRQYGFPWPQILECTRFPPDNDLCIASQTLTPTPSTPAEKLPTTLSPVIGHRETLCKPCTQPVTYESILDNYCRADIILKIKTQDPTLSFLRPNVTKPSANTFYHQSYSTSTDHNARHHANSRSQQLMDRSLMLLKDFKVKRIFKRGTFLKQEFLDPKMVYAHLNIRQAANTYTCSCNTLKQKSHNARVPSRHRRKKGRSTDDLDRCYLVMGRQMADKMILTFATAWNKREPTFRKAINKLKNFDCGTQTMSKRELSESIYSSTRWHNALLIQPASSLRSHKSIRE